MPQSSEIKIFTIAQATSALFGDLYIQQNFFCLIESGTKHIKCPINGDIIGHEGDMIIFPPDFLVSLENRPTRQNDYRALAAYIPDDLISDETISNSPIGVQIVSKSQYQEFPIFNAFQAVNDAQNLPQIIRHNRLKEPIIWLNNIGFKFARQNEDSAVNRIRKLIINNLSHPWRAKEIANHLAMSEASLRRLMMKSGTSFSNILRNCRLEIALGHLQTTNLPIIEIAYECGFKTPAHFSDSFKKRFGIPPKAIRTRNI